MAGCGGSEPESFSGRVASVSDGDTIRLADGTRVRLVQIDAPEPAQGECFGREAGASLRRVLPPGTEVRVAYDEELDREDRFGRALGYVFVGDLNVNGTLVEIGAAAPYFFDGERGLYADDLLEAATRAKAERRGLWGACPRARLQPDRPIEAGPARRD